jgi:hypothetical protein
MNLAIFCLNLIRMCFLVGSDLRDEVFKVVDFTGVYKVVGIWVICAQITHQMSGSTG